MRRMYSRGCVVAWKKVLKRRINSNKREWCISHPHTIEPEVPHMPPFARQSLHRSLSPPAAISTACRRYLGRVCREHLLLWWLWQAQLFVLEMTCEEVVIDDRRIGDEAGGRMI